MRKDNTVGMDLGDRYSHVCVLDARGRIVEEDRVRTDAQALRERFGAMKPATVAVEVGTHSPWVSRLLKELGHEVLVANAAKLRMIYQRHTKRDRSDAQMLARVARLDRQLLCPITHRSAEAQRDLQVIRSRDALVKVRTLLINHVRGSAKANGERVRACSAPVFSKRAAAQLSAGLLAALSPVLEQIASLTGQIRTCDQHIAALSERYPETEVLRTVPGVGPITALAFVLTLEDAARFTKSRHVGPYLGLTPRQDQSGQVDKQLRITKAGNRYLRRLLVGCAQYILGPFGPDTALRRWGLARCSHGGKNAKKRAVVAVARKLAVLLHRLWCTGECYQAFPESDAA